MLKRRTFLKSLVVGVGICFLPELAQAETPVVPELPRYRALLTLPSHGEDAADGGCRFRQRLGEIREGDIIARTGELDMPMTSSPELVLERLYNETQDRYQWFGHFPNHLWSDTKGSSDSLVWFERI